MIFEVCLFQSYEMNTCLRITIHSFGMINKEATLKTIVVEPAWAVYCIALPIYCLLYLIPHYMHIRDADKAEYNRYCSLVSVGFVSVSQSSTGINDIKLLGKIKVSSV